MIHNHEKILIKLIEDYHSLITGKVAKILLYCGTCTMKRALSYSTLKRRDFEKGLNILINCNYVTIIGTGKHRLFEINVENIQNLLFYPYYLNIIRKNYGNECVSLLKTLFLWGKLSINNLIERTLFHIMHTNSLEFIDDQIRQFIIVLYEKLKELISRNIIEFAYPNNNHDSNEIDQKFDQEQVFKMLKKNFDQSNNNDGGDICNNNQQQPQLFDMTSLIYNKNKSEIVKFNIDSLNFLYFIDLFPLLLGDKLDNNDVCPIFSMLLELCFQQHKQLQSMVKIEMEMIFEQYRQRFDTNCTLERMKQKLSFISHYFAPQLLQINKYDCWLNFATFLDYLIKFIVKEYLRKNFGENSIKIFGALQEEICLFENNLLTLLKIDTKELHRNLYVMDQNRMININFYSETNQSSTSGGRNVKKAFSVNLGDVVDCIMKRIQYAIYAINHRKKIELNDNKELISRKNYIENYKKLIQEQSMDDQDEQQRLIMTAHNFMSDNDHKRSEALLLYDKKVDKIEYHLINYIFIMNLWQNLCRRQQQSEECEI